MSDERISVKEFKEKYGGDLNAMKQRLALQSKTPPEGNIAPNRIISSTAKGKRIVGIDCGVNTGFAVWNSEDRKFEFIQSLMIHRAMEMIHKVKPDLVRVEDARLRKFFGNADREKLQGAGSVKRDAKIWEDFLTDYQIAFEMVAPKFNATKLTAKEFKSRTNWQAQTNEHARDAAMLVFNW